MDKTTAKNEHVERIDPPVAAILAEQLISVSAQRGHTSKVRSASLIFTVNRRSNPSDSVGGSRRFRTVKMATSGTRSRPCRARLRRRASPAPVSKKYPDTSAPYFLARAISSARTAMLGFVLSTTTDRPEASDS